MASLGFQHSAFPAALSGPAFISRTLGTVVTYTLWASARVRFTVDAQPGPQGSKGPLVVSSMKNRKLKSASAS